MPGRCQQGCSYLNRTRTRDRSVPAVRALVYVYLSRGQEVRSFDPRVCFSYSLASILTIAVVAAVQLVHGGYGNHYIQ